MKKILFFINGVKKELKRVRWPDKKYMFKYSVAVLSLGVLFSLYFYAINLIIAFIKVVCR